MVRFNKCFNIGLKPNLMTIAFIVFMFGMIVIASITIIIITVIITITVIIIIIIIPIRFNKCLEIGMKPNWVLSDEQCNIRLDHHHPPPPPHHNHPHHHHHHHHHLPHHPHQVPQRAKRWCQRWEREDGEGRHGRCFRSN